MEDYISFALYFITFFGGFYLERKSVNKIFRRLYFFWLYVFLCFGYMTGSDWRSYEVNYETGMVYSWQYTAEPLSLFTLTQMHHLIPDFWLFTGLSKCLYLYFVIRLLKLITPYYISTSSLLMYLSSVFMLISNPLRFMWALIPITFALELLIRDGIIYRSISMRRLLIWFLLFIVAVMFHSASLFFIFLFPLLYFFRNITKFNRLFIFIAFVVIVFVTSNVALLNSIKQAVNLYLIAAADIKEYSSYEVDSNSAVFSIGNIIKVILFGIILITRDKMSLQSNLDKFLYSSSILYVFLERVFILVPTGFRLVIPLTAIYAAYIIKILYSKRCRLYGGVMVLYMTLSFGKMLWSSFDLIPYSNSIPYIITEHKPYSERSDYNYKAYKNRIGTEFED